MPVELVGLAPLAHLEQTTPGFQGSSGFVRITHPHHPLCGQKVEVVRLRRGADPDLIILHPDGFHTAIAMSCTDYAGPSHHLSQKLPQPQLLDLAGLCQAAQFIDELRQLNDCSHEEAASNIGEVSYD